MFDFIASALLCMLRNMTEEIQMPDLIFNTVEEASAVPSMTWSQAALTTATGVVLPTVDVVTDWLLVGRLLSNTITMNVS